MTRIVPFRLGISNAYLLYDLGAVLVDTGSPGEGGRMRSLLAGQGVALEDLTLILHTHGHWDHCGSTKELSQWTAAPKAVHHADAEMMLHGHNGDLRPTGWSGRLLKPFLDRPFPGVEADILLQDEIDLSSFGVNACIVATPGHTAGSISVLTGGGEAIVGDLVMGGLLGGKLFPSFPTWHYFAQDMNMVRASIAKLLDLGVTRILPGHGGPLKPADVARKFLHQSPRASKWFAASSR